MYSNLAAQTKLNVDVKKTNDSNLIPGARVKLRNFYDAMVLAENLKFVNKDQFKEEKTRVHRQKRPRVTPDLSKSLAAFKAIGEPPLPSIIQNPRTLLTNSRM